MAAPARARSAKSEDVVDAGHDVTLRAISTVIGINRR